MSELSHRVLRNFVDGGYVDPASEVRSDIVNPATGRVVASAPVSSDTDVDDAYAAAARAFESWRHHALPTAAGPAQDRWRDRGTG